MDGLNCSQPTPPPSRWESESAPAFKPSVDATRTGVLVIPCSGEGCNNIQLKATSARIITEKPNQKGFLFQFMIYGVLTRSQFIKVDPTPSFSVRILLFSFILWDFRLEIGRSRYPEGEGMG